MSELLDIANAKLDAARTKMAGSLSSQIEALKRQNAAKGMLHSGNTVLATVALCTDALESLKREIEVQYQWVVTESLLVSRGSVEELVRSSREQLQPMFESCQAHVGAIIAMVNAQNATPQCTAKLEAARDQSADEIALSLRASFAQLKRRRLRNLAKALTGWLSKLFGGSVKP